MKNSELSINWEESLTNRIALIFMGSRSFGLSALGWVAGGCGPRPGRFSDKAWDLSPRRATQIKVMGKETESEESENKHNTVITR